MVIGADAGCKQNKNRSRNRNREASEQGLGWFGRESGQRCRVRVEPLALAAYPWSDCTRRKRLAPPRKARAASSVVPSTSIICRRRESEWERASRLRGRW